jgi:hypothetical protein
MKHIQAWEREPRVEAFEEVTEEEIISLWNCFQAGGLSGNEAWYAILTGIALDMAFEKGKSRTRVDQ